MLCLHDNVIKWMFFYVKMHQCILGLDELCGLTENWLPRVDVLLAFFFVFVQGEGWVTDMIGFVHAILGHVKD